MQHLLWGAVGAPVSPKDVATVPSAARRAFVFASLVALTACAPRASEAPPVKTAPPVSVAAASLESTAPVAAPDATDAPDVAMAKHWQGFGVSKCSYLAPSEDFIGDDGGVDVVFHFHAGQMSEREMRESGVRGVFVSCGYGVGSGGYARAFEDEGRFGVMMKRLTRAIGTSAKRSDVHLRRLTLASWSAGFAAVSRILAVPEWYEATDTVVLLDSLHAQYVDGEGPARGADHVDVKMLKRFVRFATDAAAGKKTMVITHSAIVPPDYASTTEATEALLFEVGVVPVAASEKNARGMTPSIEADEGGLHVRGFRGMGPRDHFDHLHMIGSVLRTWVVPRWYAPAPL
ncbi:MAG: hypothetical protein KF764_02380 [Labilithrix sp.]|nr:hypothetical protein [Labilithrix sp.]